MKEDLVQLPKDGQKIVYYLEIGRYFLMGLQPDEDWKDKEVQFKRLYRVQKLSAKSYCFRHHTVAALVDKNKGTKIILDKYKYDATSTEDFPLVIRTNERR
jgi:hypothetical protein